MEHSLLGWFFRGAPGAVVLVLASFQLTAAQEFHEPPQHPPEPAPEAAPPQTPPPGPQAPAPEMNRPAPDILMPPAPPATDPLPEAAPSPAFGNGIPTLGQRLKMLNLQEDIDRLDEAARQRKAQIDDLAGEIAEGEYAVGVLKERIRVFSEEKESILKERDDIRRSLESFRRELTDNDFFMKVKINMRTAAAPGHPLTLSLLDYFIGSMDGGIRGIPQMMEYLQREYIDKVSAKLQAWIEWANTQPASQREAQLQWGKNRYEPILASYEKQMQDYRERLKNHMEAKDRLLAMRPTVQGADARIRQIELRAQELDRLIGEDSRDLGDYGNLSSLRSQKERLERLQGYEDDYRNTLAARLEGLKTGTGSGQQEAGKALPAPAPPAREEPEAESPAEEKAPEPEPERPREEPETVEDLDGKRARLQQDIQYHLRNRDRALAELRSIQQRNGTEEQQADLRSRIAASEEFALAAGNELKRLGGSPEAYVREDLSSYDPYKLTQTDLTLMEITARERAEREATDQIVKTREFIRNTTDTADAVDLIQKLERIAGFDNQGGLRDFERLDAVREFRKTVYETRTQADFSREMLEATLADIDNTAYEIGAGRVQTGAALTLALGTGALGMTAMAGQAGLLTVTAGGSALGAQAAAAGKVLLVYNISTGTISGYSQNGVKGALEGAGKETLPINTYIAIRDGKGGASVAVGLWQDAGNVLQIYSFTKSLKSAFQARSAAHAEAGLKGPEAAFNRSWKLDQAQADFLSTQMSAQTTTVNSAGLQDSQAPAAGSAPRADKGAGNPSGPSAGSGTAASAALGGIPLGRSLGAGKEASGPFKPGESITGLSQAGLQGSTDSAALSPVLTEGATMSEVQSAARALIQDFDGRMLPALDALNSTAAGRGAVDLTPHLERQVNILRGLAEGQYSAVVADELMRRDTGEGLARSMARVSGTIQYVLNL